MRTSILSESLRILTLSEALRASHTSHTFTWEGVKPLPNFYKAFSCKWCVTSHLSLCVCEVSKSLQIQVLIKVRQCLHTFTRLHMRGCEVISHCIRTSWRLHTMRLHTALCEVINPCSATLHTSHEAIYKYICLGTCEVPHNNLLRYILTAFQRVTNLRASVLRDSHSSQEHEDQEKSMAVTLRNLTGKTTRRIT